MDDTTTSNSGSGGFENFNFDELIRGALEAASNFFRDPSITTGVSSVASEAIRDAINGVVADNSSRGGPGILASISGLSNSPTLSAIGNLASMNPLIATLMGGSDVRIAQEAAKIIGRRDYGMLRTPKSELDALMVGTNLQEYWKNFADGTSPFKKGLNQSHVFLAANWLNQSGAISSEEVTNVEGIKDKSGQVMEAAMETLSIGKNILGMGDDVYAILNQVSILGGGKGKNFEEAAKTFKSYISKLVADGLEMADIQSAVSHANGQIQNLMAAGYDANVASMYARDATAAAFSVSKEMSSKGVDYNAATESNKYVAMKRVVDTQQGGIALNARAVALEAMAAKGAVSDEQLAEINQLMVNGNLTENNLRDILGNNYEDFARIQRGLMARGSQDPSKLASQAASTRFGDVVNRTKDQAIKNQLMEGLAINAIQDYGEKEGKEIVGIAEKVYAGTASEDEYKFLEMVDPGIASQLRTLSKSSQQRERKARENAAIMNVLGAKQVSKLDIMSAEDFKNLYDYGVESGNGLVREEDYIPEALKKMGYDEKKMYKLFESEAFKDVDQIRISGEDGRDYFLDRYGITHSMDQKAVENYNKSQETEKKEEGKGGLVDVLQKLVNLIEKIDNYFNNNYGNATLSNKEQNQNAGK